MNLQLITDSLLLGIGLAMDAFSVSVAYGVAGAGMKRGRGLEIAGIFGGFQGLMPMLGYICIRTLAELFDVINRFIPWLAFIMLCYIGISFFADSAKSDGEISESEGSGIRPILLQGLATSVDAFSAGVAFTGYSFKEALFASVLISAVTFVICFLGVMIGKRIGMRFARHAGILGGIILILLAFRLLLSKL